MSPSSASDRSRAGQPSVSRRRLLSLAPAALFAGCAAPSAPQATGSLTVTNAVEQRRDISVAVRTRDGDDVVSETLSLGANAERTVEFSTFARSVAITVETADISNTVTVDLSADGENRVAVSVSETQTGWQFD
jgi:uncharacterized lipoprotein YajG